MRLDYRNLQEAVANTQAKGNEDLNYDSKMKMV